MPTPYQTVDGKDFEISISAAPVKGVTDKPGEEVFYYYASIRRKTEPGKPQKDWKIITDVDGKRPYLRPTDTKAMEMAKEFLENNGGMLP